MPKAYIAESLETITTAPSHSKRFAMQTKVEKAQQVDVGGAKSGGAEGGLTFADERPEALVQRRAQGLADSSPGAGRRKDWQTAAAASPRVAQLSALQTLAGGAPEPQEETAPAVAGGLPTMLKAGIESMSGMSMDHVKVHYNSPEPSRVNAHAYAQGQDIHLGRGQEKHLPHEAWHVVQQAQGRVKPTLQMKSGIAVNDERSLEQEADVMGARALGGGDTGGATLRRPGVALSAVQRQKDEYSADDLRDKKDAKQAQGIAETPLNAPLKFQRYRKLNRIGGSLSQKVAVPNIAPVVAGIKTFFTAIESDAALTETTLPADTVIHDQSLDALTKAAAPDSTDATPANYEAYSMLGPLDFWLHNQKKDESDIEVALRKLRLKMAERPGVSIVAHRGHGPTNRTRGGLIGQTDPRRVNHPAENSKSAFDAALAEATTDIATPELDGIECDVFLSSDDVPMLSHEGKVKEQLSTAQQLVHAAQVTDHTHIDDLSAAQLQGIRRKDGPHNADSAFMTLTEFLNATVATAGTYFGATGKPLRVEIEMKGKPGQQKIDAATSPFTGKPGAKEKKKKAEADLKTTYAAKLNSAVGKAISQFKKAHPQPHWEIILFNNDENDVLKFDEIRKQKSHLGLLYTGLGTTDKVKGKTAKADELRMGASPENLAAMKDEDNFILTFVPGAERDVRTPNAPLGDLLFNRPGGQETANVEMRDVTGTQAKIINQTLRDTRDSSKVHLLTDIPTNAKHYKTTQKDSKLAEDLDGMEPAEMHAEWNSMDLPRKTMVRNYVLAEPGKYASVYKNIFHYQRRRKPIP